MATQTPTRPLPGAFLQTPATSKYQSVAPIRQPQFGRPNSFSATYNNAQTSANSLVPQQQSMTTQSQPHPQSQFERLKPVERAAKTINDVLMKEGSYPELDSYVTQGISSSYDLPAEGREAAWAPFHKIKTYDIPDVIFEQYNQLQISTMMGLFAELNHAWIAIDNCLYLWDYTHPNPQPIGFEEQPNSITGVKLIRPRPGVFLPAITHILVVATVNDIFLLGVSAAPGPNGDMTVGLYQTRMSLPVKGIDVSVIEATSTGRIFFAGNNDNDVYELTYQQEEKWFANRCGKVNHTSPGYNSLLPQIWPTRSQEHVVQIVIDDTRNLLYTLSSESAIRTFHLDTPTSLRKVIEKRQGQCVSDISHMTPSTVSSLTSSMRIISISAISAREAVKSHLVATTSTGVRLFLSATRGYGGYSSGQHGPPDSMQVQHIKFPPPGLDQRLTSTNTDAPQPINTTSDALNFSRLALRFPPGLFMAFVTRQTGTKMDVLFLSAPDTGRIAYEKASGKAPQGSMYYEQGLYMDLSSVAQDVGLVTPPFAAAAQPIGFGNELAVQFDEPSTEIAILTNNGVHIIRRRRLVDVFSAAIRQGRSDESFEAEIRKFVGRYGRMEATAAALAVACGQGVDSSGNDVRSARVTDPETLELARKAFVEYGGRPSLNQNLVGDTTIHPIESVIPSSRHAGMALYMSRVVRSLWKKPVIQQGVAATGAVIVNSTIALSKLQSVQADLTSLSEFLDKNRSFIEGLAGPEGLARVSSKQAEIELQGEHQALHSLERLNVSIIEGISFVMMLFGEQVDQIWNALDDATRLRFKNLTFETLFSANDGKDLAKILVKAIVNRNLASGGNVDTVSERLRRQCGSFCSEQDVIIFNAQERLRKAEEAGAGSEMGRNYLMESLRLFEKVAGDLSSEYLQSAVETFMKLEFFAGATQLALKVANELDRGNKALGWVNDGKPPNDSRIEAYNARKRCYVLIHGILQAVDAFASQHPETIDGRMTIAAQKRNETYDVVNESQDEVFQFDLYDWYLQQGWTDRLLSVQSDHVVSYLERLASTQADHADLLWRFYANAERYYDAASVQLGLAKSDFDLSLDRRIKYLGNAKANASVTRSTVSSQARQILLHEISELLDVAQIQADLLQRLRADSRIDPNLKPQIIEELDGQIRGLTDLYNKYADGASYFDICLIIYQAADHRNPADVTATWQQLIESIHSRIEENAQNGNNTAEQPYEAIITEVRLLAARLGLSESTFPPTILIPMIEKYAYEFQRDVGPPTWVMDLFIDVGVRYESIVPVLKAMFYNDEAPFRGSNRIHIANELVYVIGRWYSDCVRNSMTLFGGDSNAAAINDLLVMLCNNGLKGADLETAMDLRRHIERQYL